jgi:hypothetical protein
MRRSNTLLTTAFFLFLLLMISKSVPIQAQSPFVPPPNVTLEMYRLTQPSGDNTGIPCTTADRSFGCTADPDRPYPFAASTITIDIDGPAITTTDPNDPSNTYNPAQRYLWDVVTEEYGLHLGSEGNKPLAGVQAQASAARTYLYQRIYDRNLYSPPLVVNNSAAYHVFLPYAYVARLTMDAQRRRLLEALQPRWYISPPSNALPIVALYGTDNGEYTTAGVAEGSAEAMEGNGYNPRRSIWDSISAEHGSSLGTGNGGMSSRGAARWSFGHTSSRGPAAVSEEHCPSVLGLVPDLNGDGQCWSVRYPQAVQILTHYYTDVQVRDATNTNPTTNIVTPTYRWTPLALDLAYAGCLSNPPTMRLDMQNTGIEPWDLNNVRLSYSVLFLDDAQAAQSESAIPP